MNRFGKFGIILSAAVGCIAGGLLESCHTPARQLRRAAEATRNPEMLRVAEHYAGDPRKAEAAAYLLENLRGHSTRTFDLLDARSKTKSDHSLYRPDITVDNYQEVLDSLGLTVRYRTENDAETMSADYLIRHIDLAFEGRERYPWAESYSDSVFLRYVLPYRIDAEELTDWQTFFRERYEPMIDTLSTPKTVRNVARLIIRDVNSRFGFHQKALMLKPAFTPQEAFASGRGECNSLADIFVLALRAMGIAATKDMIPVWGTSDGGHVEAVYFDEEGNPVMLDTGEWLAAGPPKIYRMEFDPQPRSADRFGHPYYRDVTREYVATSDFALTLDSAARPTERAALAVFSNERWRPVILEEEQPTPAQRRLFKEVGRGILYLPLLTDRRTTRPAGRPFRIDPRGNLQYFDVPPDTATSTTIDITSLIRRRDIDTLNADDYYVAYWTGSEWRDSGRPIRRRGGDGRDTVQMTVSGLPDQAVYLLLRKRDGRSYYRRIFWTRRGYARRF